MARKIRRLPQFPEPGPLKPEMSSGLLDRPREPESDGPRPPMLNGTPYPAKKLAALGEYLRKHGVDLLVGDEYTRGAAGYFQCNVGGRHVLALRSNPTYYTVWHEMIHYLHCRSIGDRAYADLPRVTTLEKPRDPSKREKPRPQPPGNHVPELFVYDYLRNGKRWDMLNQDERNHASLYIEGYPRVMPSHGIR